MSRAAGIVKHISVTLTTFSWHSNNKLSVGLCSILDKTRPECRCLTARIPSVACISPPNNVATQFRGKTGCELRAFRTLDRLSVGAGFVEIGSTSAQRLARRSLARISTWKFDGCKIYANSEPSRLKQASFPVLWQTAFECKRKKLA